MQPRTPDFLFGPNYDLAVDNVFVNRFTESFGITPHPTVCMWLMLSAPTDVVQTLAGSNFLLLCAV